MMKTERENIKNLILKECDYYLTGNEPDLKEQVGTLGSGTTRCIVTLENIYIQGNNESGDDEWKFKVFLGPDRYQLQFPSNGREYIVPSSASFPHTYHVGATIFDGYFQLSEGQSIGVILEVEAREIDTFSDDVSRAAGSAGIIIPSKFYYNLYATGDTTVVFQFFINSFELN